MRILNIIFYYFLVIISSGSPKSYGSLTTAYNPTATNLIAQEKQIANNQATIVNMHEMNDMRQRYNQENIPVRLAHVTTQQQTASHQSQSTTQPY